MSFEAYNMDTLKQALQREREDYAELESSREWWKRRWAESQTRIVDLTAGVESLIRAYVGLLESGRDRIKMLGGECDDVPTMERGDPALIRAKELLTPSAKLSEPK